MVDLSGHCARLSCSSIFRTSLLLMAFASPTSVRLPARLKIVKSQTEHKTSAFGGKATSPLRSATLIWGTVARSAGELWPVHYLLRSMGPDHGRTCFRGS